MRSMDDFDGDLDDDDDGVTLASSPVRVSWRVFSLGVSPVRMAGIGKESGVYILEYGHKGRKTLGGETRIRRVDRRGWVERGRLLHDAIKLE